MCKVRILLVFQLYDQRAASLVQKSEVYAPETRKNQIDELFKERSESLIYRDGDIDADVGDA
jgi:hypothetical protein